MLLAPWLLAAASLTALGGDAWPGWSGPVLLFAGYALNMLGLEIGYHRLFAHRAFESPAPVRALLAVLGSTAAVGPVFGWCLIHRRHHQHSDAPGDPHSPREAGLLHAHAGWMWGYTIDMADYRRVTDLLEDPVLFRWARADRYYLWIALGLAAPAVLGAAWWGGARGAWLGLLWGGAARVLLAQNVAFAVNSLGHSYGERTFETGDDSRDNPWLVLPTLGSGWQNTHHAFPSSYSNQWSPRRPDPGAWVVRIMAALGLAVRLRYPSPEELRAKARGRS